MSSCFDVIAFAACISVLAFVIPRRLVFYLTLAVVAVVAFVTSYVAVNTLSGFNDICNVIVFEKFNNSITFYIDKLSAFFILITNFTVLTGLIYSKQYLKPESETGNKYKLASHYFCYAWLYFSMVGVLTLRDGLPFLISWELMAVSSFMLVLYEGEKRHTLKTAVNYLVQMHIGFVFLLAAFLIAESATGILGFGAIEPYFLKYRNIGLFFLFFAGFAVKAGFVPFHTWLPEAHPAAPSHVSGVMSGVMLKMGIYGIIRVLTYVKEDIYTIGIIILVISAFSGVMGILMSVIQKDIKKSLAYSSIENIGIIGMGIGVGTIGISLNNNMLILLGFGGSMLHVLNHSLFKSLLFFSAGSVYKVCHTRDINKLGGICKKMPYTSALYLAGAVAVCGLPPLNGFVSELIIFSGLFHGMSAGSFNLSVMMLLALISLALIGGLAIFGFTRLFGISFLGTPRAEMHEDIHEVNPLMLAPEILIALLILIIGLFPVLFVWPVANIISNIFQVYDAEILHSLSVTLQNISLISFILLSVIIILFVIRKLVLRKRIVRHDDTWGCGYTASTSKQQYTGTSFSGNVAEIARPLLAIKKTSVRMITEKEIFPSDKEFEMVSEDFFTSNINKINAFIMMILKRLARLQTGYIQHYILYTFIFIIIIFILLYLGVL